MFRQILSIPLVLLVLISNIGLPVYSHICNGRGKTWHRIARKPSGCCSSSKMVITCHREHCSPVPALQPRPCCENRFRLVQATLPDFLVAGAEVHVPVLPSPLQHVVVPQPLSFLVAPILRTPCFWPHAPPLLAGGRFLLQLIQVFRN